MLNTDPTDPQDPQAIDFEKTLKAMLQSTAGRLGEDFLHRLAQELCQALGLDAAIIARNIPSTPYKLHTVAVFADGKPQDNFDYDVTGTLSERIFADRKVCINKEAQRHFPRDISLIELSAESCIGVTLTDSLDQVIGVLIGLSRQPLEQIDVITSMLEVFSFRVASELERQAINQNLRNEVIINQTQLDSVPALMFMLSKDGRFLRWNQYFSSKFGYTHEQMANDNILMAVHETDRKRIELEIEAVFKNGSGTVYLNGVTSSGEMVPMLATAEATSYNNEPVVVGVALDMTEQQNVERNLLRSQGRLARKNSQLALINRLVEQLHASHSIKHIADKVVNLLHTIQLTSSIAFCAVDATGEAMEIISSSGFSIDLYQARRRFPLGEQGSPSGLALASQKLELFPSIKDDQRLSSDLRKTLVDEGIVGGVVLPLIYKGEPLGSITICQKTYSEIPDDEIEFYQTIGSSISLALANAKQYQLMESLAIRDNLTELPNRNAFNRDCPETLKKAKYSDRYVGVVLIDLDRFKEINDTLDHQIGDKLLRLVGPRITEAANDVNTRVYRLGGDEFCLLVANKSSASEIESIAQVIEAAIAEPFVVDGLNLEISSSIGIATTQGVRHSATEMLRCAELAMYHAKSEGGGITLYSPELDANTNQRFVIMAEMAEAIRNDELVLHFQPKFDLQTRTIIGSEALVRWQHKKYGLLPPAKFIPQVELTQLINPLTYWVMKTAMAQLQEWKRQGIDVNMAINLSTRNLADDDFIEQVDQLIHQFGVSPHDIEFEVTETAVMSNLGRAIQQLSEFSQRGIQCSLDDYGTGYSSLTYIKRLPLDILKIDRSFISQMLEDKQDRIIAKSTINLAHSLGMKVIAEGVEDEKTLKALQEQGCDFIQGFYISEPLDAESFAKLYWQHRQD